MSMVARFFKFSFLIIFILFAAYLTLPSPEFPKQPSDSVQSLEEADTEATKVKRAYFTNFTRGEVIKHYQRQLDPVPVLGIRIPTYRLNYPPEDAQTLIRDQTRSTFLEEIVHPFRESLFVSGFEPRDPKDEIWYRGVHYRQKLTVKYHPTSVFIRLLIFTSATVLLSFLAKEWKKALMDLAAKCMPRFQSI